jgi:SAM-dependent methyltransferase
MEAQQLLGGRREQLGDRSLPLARPARRSLRGLSSLERALVEDFATPMQGRVLVLGCSVGHLTAQLHRIAQELHGVCESAQEVAGCRRAYPHAVFSTCDMRDLVDFAPRAFDAVLVPGDALDVLDDDERREALRAVRALLSDDGLLIFSAHNRDWPARRAAWVRVLVGSPRHPLQSALRLPRRVRNRRRLSALERCHDEYELRNDAAREFGALHYYVSSDGQTRQLSELGYELLECLDGHGRSVEHGPTAPGCRHLHYVARAF